MRFLSRQSSFDPGDDNRSRRAAAGQTKRCTAAGGMLMTNLGAVDPATTMGTATGDLRGAVGATILSTEGSGKFADSSCTASLGDGIG